MTTPATATVPFFERLGLALRVLSRSDLALQVKEMDRRSPALPPATPLAASPATAAAAQSHDAALALLGLLQREGRLVDFLEQDIESFADADVGAAARVVHDGCRKTLRRHVELTRVRSEAEGAGVDVPAGFDGAAVKLTGDVRGAPPYHGTLRHAGWRATAVKLPERVAGHDALVIAPAEIEL